MRASRVHPNLQWDSVIAAHTLTDQYGVVGSDRFVF